MTENEYLGLKIHRKFNYLKMFMKNELKNWIKGRKKKNLKILLELILNKLYFN